MSDPVHPALKSAQSIVDSMPDGVYVVDTQRRIVSWNKAAERITGWKAEEVVGTSCYSGVLAHVDADGHLLCGHEFCPLHRSIVTKKRNASPLLVYALSKRGARIPLEANVAPILDDAGKVVGGVETFRDISESVRNMEIAREVQDEAMTLRAPQSDRVEFETHNTPADLVGGDFFRVEELRPDVFAIMLADVTGHGISAALQTMFLRALWEECRVRLDDPEAFLEAMNNRLAVLATDGRFATAIYGVVDAGAQTFTYSTAGHPEPIFIGEEPLPLAAHGLPLGIISGAEYGATVRKLIAGQRVYLYSDAAYETPSPEGKLFGISRLQKILEQLDGLDPAARYRELEKALLDHGHTLRLPDDLTLIGFRLKG